MVMKPCVVLAALLVAAVSAQSKVGGENSFPGVALPSIPYDKCSVAAANDASMRLHAFALGYDNSFWVSKQAADWGPFGNWESLGGSFESGPAVIRNANNDLAVFGLGMGVGYKSAWYRVLADGVPDSDKWFDLQGKIHPAASRITPVLDPQGLLHIFARGLNSDVWEKRQYANGTEAIWGEWTSLGGVVTSDITAIVDAEGVTHLFGRGVDGNLWTMSQSLDPEGSLNWVSWTKTHEETEAPLTLSSSAHIAARLNAQNLIEIIVRGADKAFWHKRQTVNDERGVILSPWKSLGGIHASAPALQINSDSLLTIYSVGAEKGIWYKQQVHHPVDSPKDSWSNWVPLGGRFSAGVDVAADTRGYISIFGRGIDRSIWVRGQKYSNKTVGFYDSWYNLGGHFRSFAC
jgi:hypothetical protein